MPSKTQHKIQFARGRGVIMQIVVFPKNFRKKTGWYVFDDREWFNGDKSSNYDPLDPANIYGPYKSKRQAKNVAYSLAVGQKV